MDTNKNKLIILIRNKQEQLKQHELFDYVTYHSKLPVKDRFGQLQKFVIFSLTFSDAMEIIKNEYEAAKDDLGKAIYHHAKDDVGHYNFLIDDWYERTGIKFLSLSADIKKLLYDDEHLFMREYGYRVMNFCLTYLKKPIYLAYLMEAFEGTSKTFLIKFSDAASNFERETQQKLKYFQDNHLSIEENHDSLFNSLADELSDKEYNDIVKIIDEHFNNAEKMLTASLECTRRYEEFFGAVKTEYHILANKEDLISLYVYGGLISKSLKVAIQLNISQLLNDRAKHISEISQAAECKERSLHRLLNALASIGIFRHVGNGYFENTASSRNLSRSDSVLSDLISALNDEGIFESVNYLEESIRTGKPTIKKSTGYDFYGYLSSKLSMAKSFGNCMNALTDELTNSLLSAYDFSGYRSIIDIGGGQGRFLQNLLKLQTDIEGTLFETEEVIDMAKKKLNTSDIINRCHLAAGSMFKKIPSGFDAYLMKHVLHNWDDDDALKILVNVRKVIPTHGKLLVCETLVDTNRSNNQINHWLDVAMMLVVEGFERTQQEYKTLFEKSGFSLEKVTLADGNLSLLEAKPLC